MAINCCLLLALLFTNPLQENVVRQAGGLAPEFDPGLVDINEVDIAVEIRWHPTVDPHGSEFASHLEKVIRARLEASGIRVFDHAVDATGTAMRRTLGRRLDVDPNTLRWKPAAIPVLQIAVEVVSLGRDVPVALYAHTSFARLVCLEGRGMPSFQATVWSVDPVAESVRASRWRDGVLRVVLAQVESFIAARKTSAAHDDGIEKASSGPASLKTAASTSQGSFVASSSGSVFHRPNCRWAQNITGTNQLAFKTREEAVQAGKRPCRTCKP